MKIIYHCYGGAHSSITAASIHLGWLPTDRIPSTEEFISLPYFDRPIGKDHGNIRYMGNDEFKNEIYVIGRRNAAKIFENMAYGVTQIYGLGSSDIRLISVMPYVNWKMMLGGFTSRKLLIASIGRPIILAGVKFSYWQMVTLVQRVKTTFASDGQRS